MDVKGCSEISEMSESTVRVTLEDCAVQTYNDFDIYTFNYWDGNRGNILEAINNVENRLNECFLKQNIKEENRQYVVWAAKRLVDNDIQVQVLMKMNMKALALNSQKSFEENKSGEISFVRISKQQATGDLSIF